MAESRYYITEDIPIRKEGFQRNLSRETEPVNQYTAAEKFKIGIINIARGAGSSFLSVVFARFLANTRHIRPAVIELGKGSIYDSLGMDKHFAGREYVEFFMALDSDDPMRGKKNLDEGINWILRTPQENNRQFSIDQLLRLVYQTQGDVLICDLSGYIGDVEPLLHHMDHILAVVDPLPSKMLEGYNLLQKLKTSERKEHIHFIINKYNQGVNRREMLEFLKIRQPVYLPLIDMELIYTAEYRCKNPFSLGEVNSRLKEPLKTIAERLRL